MEPRHGGQRQQRHQTGARSRSSGAKQTVRRQSSNYLANRLRGRVLPGAEQLETMASSQATKFGWPIRLIGRLIGRRDEQAGHLFPAPLKPASEPLGQIGSAASHFRRAVDKKKKKKSNNNNGGGNSSG